MDEEWPARREPVTVAARTGKPVLTPSFGEYPVYTTGSYSVLSSDTLRVAVFEDALRSLAPDAAVLDLGAGGELLWARRAAELGAARSVAVEVMPDAVRQGRATLDALARRAPDVARRVRLVNALSTRVTLPEPADVCVAEVVGSFAGAEGIAAVIADARTRLLSPGAVIVPDRVCSRLAAVETRTVLGGVDAHFDEAARENVHRIFAAVGHPFDVRLRVQSPVAELATTSAVVEVYDLNRDTPDRLVADQDRAVRLLVRREGVIDALMGWLVLRALRGGPELDALRDPTSWGAVLFPFPSGPVRVKAGDILSVRARTRISDNGIHPDYRFDIALESNSRLTGLGTITAEHHGKHIGGSPLHQALLV